MVGQKWQNGEVVVQTLMADGPHKSKKNESHPYICLEMLSKLHYHSLSLPLSFSSIVHF
jgi:hypothetical protein